MAPRAPVTSIASNQRVRKSYTISKHREGWSQVENTRFIEGFFLYKRDWKKIQSHVGTKSVIQIRSHAQKFILKCDREGLGHLIPPPRPKRKASHPYPHKTPKAVRNVEEKTQGSGYMVYDPQFISDLSTNSSSLSASLSLPWDNGEEPQILQNSVDFSKVYAFLSTLFHHVIPGDLDSLKQMCSLEQAIILHLLRNIVKNMEPMQFQIWAEVLNGLHEMHLLDGAAADPEFVPETSFEADSRFLD